jgi:hypothetical protein
VERPQNIADNINTVFKDLQRKVRDRLNQKGLGILLSRHEMLGVVTEEYHELVRAIQHGDLPDVTNELIDIAVACIVSMSSIYTGQVEW